MKRSQSISHVISNGPTVTIVTTHFDHHLVPHDLRLMASWYGYTGPEPPREYLEENVFPQLLPAMEETLRVALQTERRKRFNPLDHLVTYLYTHNAKHQGRENTPLGEIPFVKEEWAVNPRPPLPLSATLTEEEAAIIIQSFFRGYLVRREERSALFRTWQRNVLQEKKAAAKIKTFWKKVSTLKSPNPDELDRKPGEMLVQDKLDSSGSSLQPVPASPLEEDQTRQEELDNSVEAEDSGSDFC